ncbi:hypothetical protein NUM3379_38570 [Kineococcus sp. NUM-3379]
MERPGGPLERSWLKSPRASGLVKRSLSGLESVSLNSTGGGLPVFPAEPWSHPGPTLTARTRAARCPAALAAALAALAAALSPTGTFRPDTPARRPRNVPAKATAEPDGDVPPRHAGAPRAERPRHRAAPPGRHHRGPQPPTCSAV